MHTAAGLFKGDSLPAVHNSVVSKPECERSTSPIIADVSDPSSPCAGSESTQSSGVEERSSFCKQIGPRADGGAGAGSSGFPSQQTGDAVASPVAASSFLGWNETTIALLRLYWADGLSATQIGKRIGCGKNAVIGKVHRLQLPARGSPITAGKCPGNAKLNHAIAADIRAEYVAFSPTHGGMALARKYGVSLSSILKVVSESVWVA